MDQYIEDKKTLYSSIYSFIENSDEESNKECFQNLTNLVKNQKIEEDGKEMLQFLNIIRSLGDNYHRDQYFNQKINQILLHYKDQIKQTLSNFEIFHLFENNKNIILFLLKNDILTITEQIYKEILNKKEPNEIQYWHFFIPEIENFIGVNKNEFNLAKNELLKSNSNFFDNYEEKRQEGENDSHICSLIRKDSIEEFIIYLNLHNISPSSQISPSIFETNQFLNENKNITMIEYSAFFGSIRIFNYLLMNNVELTSSLWLYAIHSNNAELIDLLESNKVSPPSNDELNYIQCLIESIKCHHNNIADFITTNYFGEEKEKEDEEEIVSNCFKYYNYSYIQIESTIKHGFFYLSFYHYDKLFQLLWEKKKNVIEKKII